jgi:beta-glucosidase
VHSGPESQRKNFNAAPPERDLYETYLPAFEAAIHEGGVGSVMGSYNALDGVPNCANPFLLTKLLRQQWGFQGFVVSDGAAIRNLWQFHKYVPTPEEAAAAAVKAGCDLFSSNVGSQPRRSAETVDCEALGRLLQKGLLSEQQIEEAVSRTLAARFRLGLFDPPALVPWSKLTLAQNDTPEHEALALKVARESLVLLKNDGLLPLDRTKLKRIAVVGPNADSVTNLLLGNYNGAPSHPVTILAGIRQIAGANIEVTYAAGCPLALKNNGANKPAPQMAAQALAAATSADVVIYVGGLDASLEQESAGVNYQGFQGGDRTRIELPPVQEELLKALHATGKPVVFVNCSGSAIAMPWEAKTLPAIVQAWYPGEQGGRAVAEALLGDVNPAGRLPLTFYPSTADLPAFDDYSMSNRTYRYFSGKPLFAFGYGLSYTKFQYSKARLDAAHYTCNGTVKLDFTLQNSGKREGDEVAQVYFRHLGSAARQPNLALCGFTRVHLASGQATTVALDVPAKRFRYWDTTQHQYVVEPGNYELLVGGASDDTRLRLPLKIVATP